MVYDKIFARNSRYRACLLSLMRNLHADISCVAFSQLGSRIYHLAARKTLLETQYIFDIGLLAINSVNIIVHIIYVSYSKMSMTGTVKPCQ